LRACIMLTCQVRMNHPGLYVTVGARIPGNKQHGESDEQTSLYYYMRSLLSHIFHVSLGQATESIVIER
jgi:hypothetical protein